MPNDATMFLPCAIYWRALMNMSYDRLTQYILHAVTTQDRSEAIELFKSPPRFSVERIWFGAYTLTRQAETLEDMGDTGGNNIQFTELYHNSETNRYELYTRGSIIDIQISVNPINNTPATRQNIFADMSVFDHDGTKITRTNASRKYDLHSPGGALHNFCSTLIEDYFDEMPRLGKPLAKVSWQRRKPTRRRKSTIIESEHGGYWIISAAD